MTIHDVVAQFRSAPFLFVGSGLSRRYLNTPDWRGLLKHFAEILSDDPFVYNSYESRAIAQSDVAGLLPKVAGLIQRDYDIKWFSDPRIRSSDVFVLDAVGRGVSPFKAEIAAYLKQMRQTTTTYKAEIDKLAALADQSVAGIITTNYDSFLEDTFTNYVRYIGQSELVFSSIQGVAEIYKIHGSVECPESLVINEEDYTVFAEKSAYLAAKLMTIFVEHPVIFLGYSITDRNIQIILRSLVGCLSNEQLASLVDRFVFVEYKKNAKYPEVSAHTVIIGDKPLVMRKIALADFLPLYTALEKIKTRIPVRILRMFKKELYDFTITSTPTSKLRVASIEDRRLNDEDLILAIGKASDMGFRGLSGIDADDWYRNIILEDLEFTADELFTHAFKKLLSSNSGRLPVHKYLAQAKQDFPEARQTAERCTFDAIISTSIRKNRHRLRGYCSVRQIWEAEKDNPSHALELIAHLEEPQIDINELEDVLRTLFEQDRDIISKIGPAGRTNIRRVIRIFDYLKWGKAKELPDSSV